MDINFTPDAPPSGGISFTPDPKIPDTSGIQRLAQKNLMVPKPEEGEGEPEKEQPQQTPTQRFDTALGTPLSALLSGNSGMPVNAGIRSQYVDHLQNGTADTFHDFAQTLIHAVAPIASRIAHPVDTAEGTLESLKRLDIAGEKGSREGAASGTFFPTDTMAGQAANLPFQLGGSLFGIYQSVAMQAGEEMALPSAGKELALLPEELMGTEGIHIAPPKAAAARALGPWDNLPGKEPIAQSAANALGKPLEAVTSQDIDHHIAQGAKALEQPSGKDFQDVATVTGADVKTLHVIYKETGVKPDQVFADARRDPEVAKSVAKGEVPEAYDHLMEPPIEPEKPEGLKISRDEGAKAFNVVDENGDHVQGGFTSHEEARQYIEDKRQEPIGNEPPEWKNRSAREKSEAASETIAPVERSQVEAIPDLIAAKSPNIIPPAEIGKPTSLRTFLSNNGARFNENNELVSIKKNGERLTGEHALEHAHEIAKEHGYLPKDEAGKPSAPITQLQNTLTEKNGGREAWRAQDVDRVAKLQEAAEAKQWQDASFVEHQANNVGLDTERLKDETDKQYTGRLLKSLENFYREQGGAVPANFYRKMMGDTITAAEGFVGKLTGGFFQKLGDAYIKTFAPELVGDKALRADAYMAKYKAAKQEAENAFYRQSAVEKARFEKMSPDERMQWLYDHETGRWTEHDADHARYQALLDATFKAEKEAIGADAEKGYKENYLPHAWENPEAVKAFFNSDAMIKKYGKDGFTKQSTFRLIQDGIRAGFKLKTDNPEAMLVARLLAGHDMIATMDLLRDMENNGLAKRASVFSLDKKIAKTQETIADLEKKYKEASDKINDPKQLKWDFADPAVSKYMKSIETRLTDLKARLDNFNQEKQANKLTPEQMKDLKGNGFKIIGPDSHAWNIQQQVAPLWKNAMDSKGLWERQGVTGDAYRFYTAAKNIWTSVKLSLSLFHPVHVAMINLASGIAHAADHLIQGGKISDLVLPESSIIKGFARTATLQDHPAVRAWNTAAEARTPEQQVTVQKMVEGGFVPAMSPRDRVSFKENFDKAINGVGLNNLRLIGSAIQLPGTAMKPFMEHWIPGMKAEIYLRRTDAALARDPSLATDAGKRGEVFRQIAKDTDRTYGEMNQNVQFWNKTLRDSFNAAFISGGWKLAQIYNARGLLQPMKVAYDFAKTGEFSKADITYNMLHAYTYTALTLALGGAINTMLGNPIGKAKDTVWDIVKNLVAPQTGEKNPDGTPMRLQQPAFAKEAYLLAHDIYTDGMMGGTGKFLYHQTLIPGIIDTMNNQDFTGREIISDPLDLHQWMNAGWSTIEPISLGQYEKAEEKGSDVGKVAGALGFPAAGSYLNQTPFEQKVVSLYNEQNPPKGDVYSAKLRIDLKSAKTAEEKSAIKARMREEGMTEQQIAGAEHAFTKPFAEVAWSKLSAQEQRRLIESASEEEKKKYKIKGE